MQIKMIPLKAKKLFGNLRKVTKRLVLGMEKFFKKSRKLFGNLRKEITRLVQGREKFCQTKEGKRINSHFQQHFAMFLRTKMIQLKSKKLFGNLRKEITRLVQGREKICQIPKIRQTKEGKWYFVTKIVFTYCEKKLIEKNF